MKLCGLTAQALDRIQVGLRTPCVYLKYESDDCRVGAEVVYSELEEGSFVKVNATVRKDMMCPFIDGIPDQDSSSWCDSYTPGGSR